MNDVAKVLNEKADKLDSLAKELGYEYVSEAVKKKDTSEIQIHFGESLTDWEIAKKLSPDVAVLKYRWKKIKR